MTHIDEVVERHILEYESRLKHIDELLKRASKVEDQGHEAQEMQAELTAFEQDREELHGRIQQLRSSPEYRTENMLKKAGPMGVWDAVANRLEKLVEKIERRG